MSFASTNSTHKRTNPWNFHEKILRIDGAGKLPFYESAILNFFFCFIPMKISPNLYGRMDGSKLWCFPWFPENSLLCVKLRYTVYTLWKEEITYALVHNTLLVWLLKITEFKQLPTRLLHRNSLQIGSSDKYFYFKTQFLWEKKINARLL